MRRETRARAVADRVKRANRLIETIATCGRRFFNYRDHGGTIGRFERDRRGKIFFIDGWSGKRIYTHYAGHWYGFSEGGTMRDRVIKLRDFIVHGTRLPSLVFGPWPDWMLQDLWGYGDDMQRIRDIAARLRITRSPPRLVDRDVWFRDPITVQCPECGTEGTHHSAACIDKQEARVAGEGNARTR